MDKAYDYKLLGAKLKEKGLVEVEDMAKVAVEAVLDWVVESAMKSENSYDDLLVAVMPSIKKEVLKYADLIDGMSDDEAKEEEA